MNGSQQTWQAATAYRAVEAVGAKPEDFMKMALDAARNLLLRAEASISAGDQATKARTLSAAGSIVEFMLGLTGSAPGALSERLASVYQYALGAILKANAGSDTEAAGAARVALEELAGTWRTIFPDVTGREDEYPDPASFGRREYV
jgi:flagellin-specific chaperone FliS